MAEEGRVRGLVRQIVADRRKSLAAATVAVLVGASVALAASQSGSRLRPATARTAEQTPSQTFSADPKRAEIERVVRDYILAHPEIIQEAATLLRERELAKVIDAHRPAFETPFGSAWAGDADGDVVLVEFFDYACSFCRASKPDVDRLLKEDNKLKVVWRELPVLGADSVAAAHASLAAAKQGRFHEFHDRLFAAGTPTPEAVAEAQEAAGVAAAESDEFQQEIERNFQLAGAIQAGGTPVFVVGDKVLQGAVGYDALKQAVEEARTEE